MAIVSFFFSAFGVFSCWWMTIMLLRAWWVPLEVENGAWVKFGVGVMIMEFVIVHSGGFLAGISITRDSPAKRFLALGGLILFYSAAAFLIAHEFRSIQLLYSFGFIMLSRLLNSFHAPSKQEISIITARSALSAALYILAALLSVLVPLPAGGITPEILNRVYPDRGSGLWELQPQRALAAGAIYFFILGIFELMVSGDAFDPRPNEERRPLRR